MNELIVYRNPIDAWFWTTGAPYVGMVILSVVVYGVFCGGLDALVEKVCKQVLKLERVPTFLRDNIHWFACIPAVPVVIWLWYIFLGV